MHDTMTYGCPHGACLSSDNHVSSFPHLQVTKKMAKEKGKGQGELDDMKKELEWDEHKVPQDELIKRYQVSWSALN